MSEQDERIEDAEDLRGENLVRKRYRAPSPEWDHDHCAACWKTFMEGDDPQFEHEGYTTTDACPEGAEYWWVCIECFNDLHEILEWHEVSSAPESS